SILFKNKLVFAIFSLDALHLVDHVVGNKQIPADPNGVTFHICGVNLLMMLERGKKEKLSQARTDPKNWALVESYQFALWPISQGGIWYWQGKLQQEGEVAGVFWLNAAVKSSLMIGHFVSWRHTIQPAGYIEVGYMQIAMDDWSL
ncbi:hypothetical protein ACJX0J_018329, partial [Zea mays]